MPVPRRTARVLPACPVGAIGAVLALPDWHALLDAIDQEAARAECFGSVGRAGRADDRDVPDSELPDAMPDGQASARHLLLDLGADASHLLLRHRRVGLVLEKGHGMAVAVIAHGSKEDVDAARDRICHFANALVDRQRLGRDAKVAHLEKLPERPPDFSTSRVGPITM